MNELKLEAFFNWLREQYDVKEEPEDEDSPHYTNYCDLCNELHFRNQHSNLNCYLAGYFQGQLDLREELEGEER